MVQEALDRWGQLDILVNNAGTTHRNQPMTEVTEEEYERIFAVNVKSVYLSARHVVPVMKKQGFGVILNVASTAGVRPRPGLVWYNTSKGAMITARRRTSIPADLLQPAPVPADSPHSTGLQEVCFRARRE